jgi:hypothetical protein
MRGFPVISTEGQDPEALIGNFWILSPMKEKTIG